MRLAGVVGRLLKRMVGREGFKRLVHSNNMPGIQPVQIGELWQDLGRGLRTALMLPFFIFVICAFYSGITHNPSASNTADTSDSSSEMSASAQFSANQAANQQVASTNMFGRLTTTDVTSINACPIDLVSRPGAQATYSVDDYTESWQALSNLTCQQAAEEILITFRDSGYLLNRAGYIDLFGEAWSCTVYKDDGEVLIVTLIPEKKSLPRGPDNQLVIRVVHIFVPTELFDEVSHDN